MAMRIEPSHDVVVLKVKSFGLEAIWQSDVREWIVRIPGSPVRTWYYTDSGIDAILTAKVMDKMHRNKTTLDPLKILKNKVANGVPKQLTREQFLHYLQTQIKPGKQIYLNLHGFYIRQSKTSLIEACVLALNIGELCPFWIDTTDDRYNYVVRAHPLISVDAYKYALELPDEEHSPIRQEEEAADDTGGV